MPLEVKTTDVPHLGGVTTGYKLSNPFNPLNPTVVLLHAFSTTAEFYDSWLCKVELTSKINLLAVEFLGHGKTKAHKVEHWTYWDSSMLALQVMDMLKIEKAYVLGVSQGGFTAVRMALLQPQKINGLILMGTSMDREGPEIVANGGWDGLAFGAQMIAGFSGTPEGSFVLDPGFTHSMMTAGIGANATPQLIQKWIQIQQSAYAGEEGRKRLRMAAICLRDRDSLYSRLPDITCPVLWMQGTEDSVFGVKLAKMELELFVNARSKEIRVIEGGGHYLSTSNPTEVADAMLEFIGKA